MDYRIKQLRKKNGDTLKELAMKLNYDYSNLSKIERGIHVPSLELLRKIAEVYNVNMSYFFVGENRYTAAETSFMDELDICREEFLQKYNIMLDGQKLSKTELELIVEIIRKLRTSINANNSQN